MAEEVVRMQEGTDAVPEAVKETEPMGTVIPMESAKPAAAEKTIKAQETEDVKIPEGISEEVLLKQALEEEPKHMEEKAGRPAFCDPPAAEAKEHLSSAGPAERPDHDREKKRMNDFFHLRKDMEDFTREDWILSRLPEEDLMEYLTMEQQKSEMLQKAKEIKEKRIFTTLQIAISMSAIVGVVALLKDDPTVLVNILYITGIVIALWIWRGKQDK